MTPYERARSKPYAETFRCPGGELRLDFCNTGHGLRNSTQAEWLTSYAELVSWLDTAGAISRKQAAALHATAQRSTESAKRVWSRAIRLRDAVADVLLAKAGDRAPANRYVMKLSGSNRTQTLSRTDPIWQKWKQNGAMRLVAIAFIPGLSGSGEGERDPRRIILPLDKNRWKELVDIRIIASQSGLTCPTQPEPEKK